MTTVTLWLLVAVNSIYNSAHAGHYTVLERFATQQDCEQVAKALPKIDRSSELGVTRCIQARVARP